MWIFYLANNIVYLPGQGKKKYIIVINYPIKMPKTLPFYQYCDHLFVMIWLVVPDYDKTTGNLFYRFQGVNIVKDQGTRL